MKQPLPKMYLEFIETCRNKEYGELFTHKHHIIPRFMGGTDAVDNKISLSVEDHFMAHKILAENCEIPNHRIGNKLAAAYLTNRYKDLSYITKEEIGKLISEAKKEYFRNNINPLKGRRGRKLDDSTKESITNGLKRYYTYNSQWNKGKECPQLSTAIKLWHAKNDNPFKGRTHTNETRKLMSDHHADVSGGNNPASRKCIDILENKVYSCIKEMANAVGVPRTTMNRWIKDIGKQRFKYIEK